MNAESDFLSGLIVDKYEDVLVVQISAWEWTSANRSSSRPSPLFFRRAHPRTQRRRRRANSKGSPKRNGLLAGELAGPIVVNMNGLNSLPTFLTGHKTGLYLDQQANYFLVGDMARGAQVLDCFQFFVGGFGLHAARAGAAHVHLRRSKRGGH